MTRTLRLGFPLSLALSLAPPASGQTQAVVYPDGRVFVRRTLPQALTRGITVVPLPSEAALPGSLVALDSGVSILSARTPVPNDPASLLRKAIGRRVVFRMSAGDTVGAVVLATDPNRFQLADGSVVVSLPGTILFPADIAGPARLASITVQSTQARPRFEVGYVMNGIWWQAHYTLSLAGRRGRLTGAALLTSEGVALDSAEITLLDGTVSRVQPSLTARTVEERARMSVLPPNPTTGPAGPDSVLLYRLAGRYAINPSEIVSLPLMADGTVDVLRVLSVPGMLPTGPALGRVASGSSQLQVNTLYHLAGAALLSLPPGTARIYGPVGTGPSTLIAEAVVSDPARGGHLDLNAGPSAEVLAIRTAYEGIAEQDTVVGPSGGRTVRTSAVLYEESIRMQNRTEADVVVELVEQRNGPWSVASSSVPPEPLGEGVMRFRIPVPARGTTLFTARLRVPVL